MLRKKAVITLILLSVIAVIVGAVYYINATNSSKTISPNGEYTVSYNKFAKIITTLHLQSKVSSYLTASGWNPAKNPDFFWSPDSRYLAIVYSDVQGYKWTEVIDFVNNSGLTIPMKSEIQDLREETRTSDPYNNSNAEVYITEWLDNTHALVKFSWPSDTSVKIISGWYTCVVPSHSVIDLHIVE